MSIQSKKVESDIYGWMRGLDVWDNDITTLPEGIAMINGEGKLYLSNESLVSVMQLFPQVVLEALKTESRLRLSTIDARGTEPMDEAIRAGGYGLINQARIDYLNWLATPNNDKGGH